MDKLLRLIHKERLERIDSGLCPFARPDINNGKVPVFCCFERGFRKDVAVIKKLSDAVKIAYPQIREDEHVISFLYGETSDFRHSGLTSICIQIDTDEVRANRSLYQFV